MANSNLHTRFQDIIAIHSGLISILIGWTSPVSLNLLIDYNFEDEDERNAIEKIKAEKKGG